MDDLALIIIAYVAFGIGLLWLSVWLTRRIRPLWVRVAIYGGVFAFWFSPGMAAGQDGVLVAPIWLILLGDTYRYLTTLHTANYNPYSWNSMRRDFYYGGITFGIVWMAGFGIALSVAGIWRWLRKDERLT